MTWLTKNGSEKFDGLSFEKPQLFPFGFGRVDLLNPLSLNQSLRNIEDLSNPQSLEDRIAQLGDDFWNGFFQRRR